MPSSPVRLEETVVRGVRDLGATAMALGTTVATNAVLEGRGARTALVTTAGFEDVIAIGRQDRPSLYDFRVVRPEPLVPAERRFGVSERVAADGSVVRPLDSEGVAEIAAKVRACGVESVAVCLLFSFLRPEHEVAIRSALGDLPVSLSSEVLPEFREDERAPTTPAPPRGAHPIAAPVVDTTSAGGGGRSVAWFAAGGALRVGPRSAGA